MRSSSTSTLPITLFAEVAFAGSPACCARKALCREQLALKRGVLIRRFAAGAQATAECAQTPSAALRSVSGDAPATSTPATELKHIGVYCPQPPVVSSRLPSNGASNRFESTICRISPSRMWCFASSSARGSRGQGARNSPVTAPPVSVIGEPSVTSRHILSSCATARS